MKGDTHLAWIRYDLHLKDEIVLSKRRTKYNSHKSLLVKNRSQWVKSSADVKNKIFAIFLP